VSLETELVPRKNELHPNFRDDPVLFLQEHHLHGAVILLRVLQLLFGPEHFR
jgi:hypothetical protein